MKKNNTLKQYRKEGGIKKNNNTLKLQKGGRDEKK
jgi:hypothetical protein